MNAQNGAQSVYGLPMCPVGGECRDCDRTSTGCVAIFGPESDHAEALRMNAPTMRPDAWVCSFFQSLRSNAALCGVCGQTRARHTERDQRCS